MTLPRLPRGSPPFLVPPVAKEALSQQRLKAYNDRQVELSFQGTAPMEVSMNGSSSGPRSSSALVCKAQAPLTTEYGQFRILRYENFAGTEQCLALVAGEVDGKSNVLVRIKSKCLTGEVFHDLACDCRHQLADAMTRIQAEPDKSGVVIYLFQEGKGNGLNAKLEAQSLVRAKGIDVFDAYRQLGLPADARRYDAAAAVLADLRVDPRIRLLTNNPDKISQLENLGLKVERVPSQVPQNQHNLGCLRCHREKYGHLLNL